ncbi:hypothetical protein CV102_16375 [Natronococcus pandeyae]|uniref:Uncharacterized protein n=1 Tax=Natronococcus pandeyae TaxID=2055836 RepID=A0A8J8Q2W7_9EURY|nr:hypothetical protein CV102_16375 [Natronococcus pandeyae]
MCRLPSVLRRSLARNDVSTAVGRPSDPGSVATEYTAGQNDSKIGRSISDVTSGSGRNFATDVSLTSVRQ